MRAVCILVGLAVAACALVACAKTRIDDHSSETHFLARCETSCGEGLSCLCGVCSEACELGDSCASRAASAQCEAAQDHACSTAAICDVTCERDADCNALSPEHTCSEGRCRAPGVMALPNDAGALTAASCSVADVVSYLHADQTPFPCAGDAGSGDAGSSFNADCASAASAAQAPFFVSFSMTGDDSLLTTGYLGRAQAEGYQVYELYSDSFGFTSNYGETASVSWTPCTSFEVEAGCERGAACFTCVQNEAKSCYCAMDDGGIRIVCSETRSR